MAKGKKGAAAVGKAGRLRPSSKVGPERKYYSPNTLEQLTPVMLMPGRRMEYRSKEGEAFTKRTAILLSVEEKARLEAVQPQA